MLAPLMLALALYAAVRPAQPSTPPAPSPDGAVVYAHRSAFDADFPEATLETFAPLDSARLYTRFWSPLHAGQVGRLFRSDSLPKAFAPRPGFAIGAADIGVVVAEHDGRRTLGNNAYGRPLVITFGGGVQAAGVDCFPQRSAAVTAYAFSGEPLASAIVQSEPGPSATASGVQPHFVGFASTSSPIGYVVVEHLDGGEQTDVDDLAFWAEPGGPARVSLRSYVRTARVDPVSGLSRISIGVALENHTVPVIDRLVVRLRRVRGASHETVDLDTVWTLRGGPIAAGARTRFTALSPAFPTGTYAAVLIAYTPDGEAVASLPIPF